MFTLVVFLLILSLLVVVHEFGHFIVARKSGMRVFEFGLGFPPRILGVYRDPESKKLVLVRGRGQSNLSETMGGKERRAEFPATLYSLNCLPLGGFCSIKGESGDAVAEPDSFAHKSAGKRLAVLFAGVIMNILLAAVVLSIGFGIGLPTDVSQGIDPGAEVVGTIQVMVQEVIADSPAKRAGLAAGDQILALNDQPIHQTKEVIRYVHAHGAEAVNLTVRHQGKDETKIITPAIIGSDTEPRLGLLLADAAFLRYPWYRAIGKGITATGIGLVSIVVSFYFLVKELVLGHGLSVAVSGPVGIAVLVGQSARLGVHYLLNIIAMISLSLAVMNALPIPALDGGRALFVIIEKIRRRPLSMKHEQLAHTIGFLLLMILVVIVTSRDIAGLIK